MESISVIEAVESSLARIEKAELRVRAFVAVDGDRARVDATNLARRDRGELAGVTLGIKDIFETADLPTEYGSPIYEGFRPRGDAAVVATLRQAGTVCIGKTVTTEFALSHPGPTRNPHRLGHTPGGSSSGSAAAVAAGMVDLAIGSQTAGSVIRPASFCGVFGYKPTFGLAPVAGMKAVAPSLDTPGFFARDPWLLDRVRALITGRQRAAQLVTPPRVGLVRCQWERLSEDSKRALITAAERVASAGALVTELSDSQAHDELMDRHEVWLAYEAARSLAWEHSQHYPQLSSELQRRLDAGLAVNPGDYDDVRELATRARSELDGYFEGLDVVLAASVPGEAPEGLDSTGDSRFCRLWTALGVPAVTVPGLIGSHGLPVGVQVIARPLADATALAAAAWLYPYLSGLETLPIAEIG